MCWKSQDSVIGNWLQVLRFPNQTICSQPWIRTRRETRVFWATEQNNRVHKTVHKSGNEYCDLMHNSPVTIQKGNKRNDREITWTQLKIMFNHEWSQLWKANLTRLSRNSSRPNGITHQIQGRDTAGYPVNNVQLKNQTEANESHVGDWRQPEK